MKSAPTARTAWHSGLMIRTVVVYLPWAILAWRASMLPVFVVVALAIEAACFMVSRRALAGSGDALLLSSYLSVGDVVWFAGAVGFALLSGIVPPLGFVAMTAVWIGALLANFYIVGKLRRTGPLTDVEKVIGRSTPGNRDSEASLKRIDKMVAIGMFALLTGIGITGVLLFYILDMGSWLLASLAVGFLGLACAFSPQIRPLLMWRRLNAG